MIVCIAEKPSVARDIADVLGAREKKDGYIEGNGYQVTWTFGHLCTLKEPHEYTPNWKSWSLGSLPMIPPRFGNKLISNPTYERQFHTIENLMQHADMIINCGDAGQEGELIQRWVMQKAGARCPVKRLWISSLTEEAIREGFAKLRDASDFQPLYEAGLSRAIGDWLLGMNATRLYTMKYGQNRQVLSIGRVQTPTLALIVNRQLEIQNFVPKQYWELKTVYRDTTFSAILRKSEEELVLEAEKQKEAIAAGKKPKKEEENRGIDPITDRERGLALLDQIKNFPFTVTDVTKKEGREAPLRLFDLTSLQVECNKKFAYSADETLKIIQSLYEKKVATYPRVDTTYLSDDIYPKCPGILKGLRDYETFTAPLTGTALLKSKKVFDNSKVTDHHALIVTENLPGKLETDEQAIYELIAGRMLEAFSEQCVKDVTSVTLECAGSLFTVKGFVIKSAGWRAVFGEKEDGEDNATLLVLHDGDSLPLSGIELLEKQTKPKPLHTESSLLSSMETAGKELENADLKASMKDTGIGTPATRAAIIETLFSRQYIIREKKNLVPTEKGLAVYNIIRDKKIADVEMTGMWENTLAKIESGEMNPDTFRKGIEVYARQITAELLDVQLSFASGSGCICPKCKIGRILFYPKVAKCSNVDCSVTIFRNKSDKQLTDKQITELVTTGKTGLIKGFKSKNGKVFDASLTFDEQFNVTFVFPEKKGKPKK